MINSKIPSSRWVIQPNYFKAKFVEDFSSKYLLWLSEYDGDPDEDAIKFAASMQDKGVVDLYQQPFDPLSNNCPTVKYEDIADYFEKYDDNHVIPRHLFDLIENANTNQSDN